MKKEVSRFTVGGTAAGPSIPGGVIQQALGTKIQIDVITRCLYVPTSSGTKTARPGDTVVAYDDGTFDVEVHS